MGDEHEHVWVLIAEEPITFVGRGYVQGWGDDYPVQYQTGVRRRFYCSGCREVAEDTEKWDREQRVTP